METKTTIQDTSYKDVNIKFNADGLVPAIAQDCETGEVLMLAYMNKEAFDLTAKTGKGTYYSRSRQELWIKGETSGHYQYVQEIRYDCDCDTVLLLIKQEGAACHTNNYSCFYRRIADFNKAD
jgi:phosphoribosyl-ATP pyrophosphohydrolase/phosphoribosyl-AMP cyclohydrolase